MKQGFDRRIFTAKTFLADSWFLFTHMPRMAGMAADPRITRLFIEKIMSVVSAVNGCVYCSWFHAKQAIESGMSEEEVENLFKLQFQTDADPSELPALLYAQHYAETNRNPDPEMTTKLVEAYGEKTAGHVLLIIRMIFFGNLLGNTWDAVLSRMKGNPAKGSNAAFEFVFFLMTWFFMGPATVMTREYRRKVQGSGA